VAGPHHDHVIVRAHRVHRLRAPQQVAASVDPLRVPQAVTAVTAE
jgi:hypothetical protein